MTKDIDYMIEVIYFNPDTGKEFVHETEIVPNMYRKDFIRNVNENFKRSPLIMQIEDNLEVYPKIKVRRVKANAKDKRRL